MTEVEKKGIGKAKIGLVVCVVLVVILAVSNGLSYSNLHRCYSQYDTLETSYNNYVSSHHYLDSDYDAIKDERDGLKAPKLIKNLAGLHWIEENGIGYISFGGQVFNVGAYTAYDCKLHVKGYQDSFLVVDTYVLLGTIEGESIIIFDEENNFRASEMLSSWSITPEWTS